MMATEQAICELIRDRQIIQFFYKGRMRRAEPYLLGYDFDGDLTLSVWQLEGGSGVGFRDFHATKLSALSSTGQTFSVPKPGYNPNDKTIDRIVCRV